MDKFYGRVDVASSYGIGVAVFVDSLMYWAEHNASEKQNFFDGRYWTFRSLEGFARNYPIWSKDQVRRIIAKCKEADLILVADYNEDPYTRTKWYAPSDKTMELYGCEITADGVWRNRHIGVAEELQGYGEIATCNNVKEKKKREEEKEKINKKEKVGRKELDKETKELLRAYVGEDYELAKALDDLIEIREAKRAINSAVGIKALLKKLDKLSEGRRADKLLLLEESIANSWKSVFPLKRAGPSAAAPPSGPVIEERGTYEL